MWEVTNWDCDKNREAKEKKATAHICTDSDGGLVVTIYYDLSDEQLTIPCEVIQISFFPHMDIHWFLFWEGCVKVSDHQSRFVHYMVMGIWSNRTYVQNASWYM